MDETKTPNSATGTYVDAVANGEPVRAFVPNQLPPDPPVRMDAKMLGLFGEASEALGGLRGVAAMLPDLHIFLYSYVRKEAVLSSQIEGTRSTLSEFLSNERPGAAGALDADIVEVSNHVAALDHGVTRMSGGFPISNRLIREMHEHLLRRGRGSERLRGEFRRSQVWIGHADPGTARFVPPPANYVQDLMSDLERFIHADDGIPPLLRAGYAHVQFETIHPFEDGNGRIGRILITMMLIAHGVIDQPLLYLSLYFKNNRSDYYDLLDGVRTSGEWNAWMEFFLIGVRDMARGAVNTASRLRGMFAADRQKVQGSGRQAGSLLRVHESFMNVPVLTVPEIAQDTEMPYQTANNAVSALADLGILAEITGRDRNRVYKYTQYLDVLSEGTEPL